MKDTIKLPFGLDENNNLVHISDVKNGKACNCVCQSCKSPLIAAHGKINQHHFRHVVDSECASNPESAIHMAAKKMIVDKRMVSLPEYASNAYATDSRGIKHTESETIVKNGTIVLFDSVEDEKSLNGMRVDLLAKKDETSLIIEIYYRHQIDDQKIEKIKNENTSAIEIDLNHLTLGNVKDLEAFWLYLNDTKHSKWLHNAKDNDDVQQRLKNRLALKIQGIEEEYEKDGIRKISQQQEITSVQNQALSEKIRNQNQAHKNPDLMQALEELKPFRSENYIAQLTQEAEIHPLWKLISKNLQISLDELPDYLNVNVPDGDWIFGCDRRIWQSAIFCNYFINRKSSQCDLSIMRVDSWLTYNAKLIVPRHAKAAGMCDTRQNEVLPTDTSRSMPSSWNTLRAYFNHLCQLKMLVYTYHDHRHLGNLWYAIITNRPAP